MELSFPHPVNIRSSVPTLAGMRHAPFINIDGEAFGKPTLNGFWQLDLNVIAQDMQSQLALSAFVTAMSAAGAECVVPVLAQWLPNDSRGRMLHGTAMAPAWTFDHMGFASEPFEGFTLRANAAARASYVNVNTPALSHLSPGHYITLGDRLHQVVNATFINENPRAQRLSIMPNLREAHTSGTVVIVDQLRLRCRMESGDQIGGSIELVKFADLSFIEAF